jgi:hypothetical protein
VVDAWMVVLLNLFHDENHRQQKLENNTPAENCYYKEAFFVGIPSGWR